MLRRVFVLSAWLTMLAMAVPTLAAQTRLDAEGHEWWQHAVFYEIYPRSFADSNNDGVGDLNGITSKLDYLSRLGVDAIWITPCFPSPQVDFGYDVSDYENIDPAYGTLADFDRLVKVGRERKIKVILDFVVNHTSDQHPWFLDSKSSRNAFHRDWYIWRDGRGPASPPTTGFRSLEDQRGSSIRPPANTITTSSIRSSLILTGETPRLRKRCSTSLAGGTSAVSRAFASMLSILSSRTRTSPIIRRCPAEISRVIRTCRTSTTPICRSCTRS